MCGRYRNLQSWTEMHGAMEPFLGPTTQPALNIQRMEQVRPTNAAPVIRMQDGAPVVCNARWVLIPYLEPMPSERSRFVRIFRPVIT